MFLEKKIIALLRVFFYFLSIFLSFVEMDLVMYVRQYISAQKYLVDLNLKFTGYTIMVTQFQTKLPFSKFLYTDAEFFLCGID